MEEIRLSKEPICETHNLKDLGYIERQEWAERQLKAGKKQTQCDKCGRWFFASEM